jgi:hypothetical protein
MNDYPRLKQLGVPVHDEAPIEYVLVADINSALAHHNIDQHTFEEMFGVQTAPVIEGKGRALYPWDTEAVLERMISGRLTGTQLFWD